MKDSKLEPVVSMSPAQVSLDTITGPSELGAGNLESLQSSLTSTSSTKDRWMRVMVKRNKSFLAQNINQVGHEITKINRMLPPPEYPLGVLKAFFPRSVVYEIEYKKKQAALKIEEALRKEREALAEKVKLKLIKANEETDEKDNNDEDFDKLKKEKEPFWYKDGEEVPIPNQNPADYDVNKFLTPEKPEQKNVAEELGITVPDNYIPGQVGGNPMQQSPQQNRNNNDEDFDKLKKEKGAFWYKDGEEVPIPKQNSADYDVSKFLTPEKSEQKNVAEELGMTVPDNYIPGQVGGNPMQQSPQQNRTKELENKGKPQPVLYEKHGFRPTPKEMTETEKNIKKFADQCHPKRMVVPGLIKMYPNDYMGKTGRQKKERPLRAENYVYRKTDFKGNLCKDFPENKARLTKPWDDLRSQEFMKVGKPFKTEAVRWSECALPAFNPEEEILEIRERLQNKPKPKKLILSYCERAKLIAQNKRV